MSAYEEERDYEAEVQARELFNREFETDRADDRHQRATDRGGDCPSCGGHLVAARKGDYCRTCDGRHR